MSVVSNTTRGRQELSLAQRVARLEKQIAVLQASMIVLLRKLGAEAPKPDGGTLGVSATDGVHTQDIFGGG